MEVDSVCQNDDISAYGTGIIVIIAETEWI